jgi:hypothetical protein
MFALNSANQSHTPKASSDHAANAIECIANLPHTSESISAACIPILAMCVCICVDQQSGLSNNSLIGAAMQNTHTLSHDAALGWLWHQMTAKAKRLALAINWNCCLRLAGAVPLNHRGTQGITGDGVNAYYCWSLHIDAFLLLHASDFCWVKIWSVDTWTDYQCHSINYQNIIIIAHNSLRVTN